MDEGAIALLGDAAHAMLPFAAQGAGMAIEDAAVLAQSLERKRRRKYRRHPGGVEALRAAAPRPRAAGSARRAAAGTIYHLTGPLALARDLAIKALGPKRMLARQDWIYDWRA